MLVARTIYVHSSHRGLAAFPFTNNKYNLSLCLNPFPKLPFLFALCTSHTLSLPQNFSPLVYSTTFGIHSSILFFAHTEDTDTCEKEERKKKMLSLPFFLFSIERLLYYLQKQHSLRNLSTRCGCPPAPFPIACR
jgi:hypothetical protein